MELFSTLIKSLEYLYISNMQFYISGNMRFIR